MWHMLILAYILTCVSGWKHDLGDGWNGWVSGNADTRGNWGASIGSLLHNDNVRTNTIWSNGRVEAG
ncbi:hypothetical protein DPMN_013158 [Dreissena polymorpha]|uniref:Uncharacterized protein n=1 Tax=Dreissena polymorpha TaxID=45954 RepID=A0A9D4S1L2_DREPO|nr:hypothetical protein DPMN_013158 [Dreissena polymorpha]